MSRPAKELCRFSRPEVLLDSVLRPLLHSRVSRPGTEPGRESLTAGRGRRDALDGGRFRRFHPNHRPASEGRTSMKAARLRALFLAAASALALAGAFTPLRAA